MALDTIPKQEGGKLKAIASGTLPSGDPVVVNADGTVSVVAEVSVSGAVGSAVVYEAGQTSFTAATYDSNSNKVVIAYNDSDNSQYGTAVVGTVSGTTISFGTPVVFHQTSALYYVAATFDSSENKVVIAYNNGGSSGQGTAIVGTVSGTSISFGSAAVFETGNSIYISATFDSFNNKVVIACRDASNSNYGTAAVGTVSGTSISFGSPVVFESARTDHIDIGFDSSNNKVVIAYEDDGNSNNGTAIVGTVSGTSISFGSAVVYDTSATNIYNKIAYDSVSNKVVITYNSYSGGYQGSAIVGTVSGTSISFGSKNVFNTSQSDYLQIVYNSAAKKLVIAYSDQGNSSHLTLQEGEISGNTISFGSDTILDNTGDSNYISMAYDTNENVSVVAYAPVANTNKGTAIVRQTAYSSTNLTAENYIGMSGGGAVADGGNANVNIIGSVSDEQSGLTAGQQYYVQTDGTLSETPADPSVLAGTAISATKMLVKT